MPPILTLPRTHAPALPAQGCWPVDDLAFLAHTTWLDRTQAEHDETHLQLIPYLVLCDAAGRLWCYQRSGGDARLQGRCSCGVGGHVDAGDADDTAGADDANSPAVAHPAHASDYSSNSLQRSHDKGYSPISHQNATATLQRALLREVAEELGAAPADLAGLRLLGLIYEGHTPVGRVHLGLLYQARWLPQAAPQPLAGEALHGLGFYDAAAVAADPAFELWSRLAAQRLVADAALGGADRTAPARG